MLDNSQVGARVALENYKFTGLDSSLVGGIQSVTDYFRLPLSAARIYGLTGLAFLLILDEWMVEPNGGPPEPDVFRLARNLGIRIEGFHEYAESEAFARLQAEAWESAKLALQAKQPVFAKNIDIANQTSVVHAIDEAGYYTYTWHTGFKHSDEVIPWSLLGRSQCPCIQCVNTRKSVGHVDQAPSAGGLISLHWGTPISAAEENKALHEALEFVIGLQEQGQYEWMGKTYFVGSKAYDHWLAALERQELDKYFFSLFVEILEEARHHAVLFLNEWKEERGEAADSDSIDGLIQTYSEVASRCRQLERMYPYSEPRQHELNDPETCKRLLLELRELELEAFAKLKGLYVSL